MTYERLKRYRSLQISIVCCDSVIKEIDELADGLTDNVSIKKLQHLKAQQLNKRRELVYELARLTEYIKSIEDEETQNIYIAHFICGNNYSKIAQEMYLDRRTVARKIQKHLNDEQSANSRK